MGHLEHTAHLPVTPEKDTKTIRYDWFIDRDGTECEFLQGLGSSPAV